MITNTYWFVTNFFWQKCIFSFILQEKAAATRVAAALTNLLTVANA